MKVESEDSPAPARPSNPGAFRAGPTLSGGSTAHRRMLRWVGRVAPCRLPVLVHGESGSGKEGVSRMLHTLSPRAAAPFVAVNCTALAETLLEAELFGAVRGAYTGLDRDRPGLFRRADGGTLFLDEVGDMSPAMQAKLLRVLEDGSLRPVGAEDERPVDVRIVAATHRDLRRMVLEGAFRGDLYYRLAVLRVDVPPLRSRIEDLPQIVESLASRLQRDTGHGPLRLSGCAWRELRAREWPGNVRELYSVLAGALLRSACGTVRADDLERRPIAVSADPPTAPSPAAASRPNGLERAMIEAALVDARGCVTLAATRIGWSRQKLYRRMQALAIGPAPGDPEAQSSLRGTTSSDSSTFQ